MRVRPVPGVLEMRGDDDYCNDGHRNDGHRNDDHRCAHTGANRTPN